IFLYNATDAQLKCVSCDPSGAPPSASAQIPPATKPIFGGGGPFKAAGHLQRNLADDGRVFFSTAQKLLPEAMNGKSNVYEYAAGSLRLLSTGTSGAGSYFYDATPSGNDAFIITAQDLPSGDQGTEFKVYDARVGGGFAAPPSREECREEG